MSQLRIYDADFEFDMHVRGLSALHWPYDKHQNAAKVGSLFFQAKQDPKKGEGGTRLVHELAFAQEAGLSPVQRNVKKQRHLQKLKLHKFKADIDLGFYENEKRKKRREKINRLA